MCSPPSQNGPQVLGPGAKCPALFNSLSEGVKCQTYRIPTLIFGTLAASLSFGQQLYYGGDFARPANLSSEINTGVTSSMTYDNFTVGGAGWNVNGIGGTFLVNTSFSSAFFEIRSGMSVGNGGTLVASGTFAATSNSIGSEFTLDIREYDIDIPTLFLAAGDYHVGLSLVGTGSGRAFVTATEGTNGVGGPLNDENSFFNSAFFNADYALASGQVGAGKADFSLEINGTQAVPEPATMAALGFGAIALIRKKRKQA